MKKIIAFLAIVVWTGTAPGVGEKVNLSGYAEYYRSPQLIVEGQRVISGDRTRFKGKNVHSLASIPLGWEVKVQGRRQLDGTILAERVEAKENGLALFETDVLQATDQIEQIWVQEGAMFTPRAEAGPDYVGRIVPRGRQVERVRRIMDRLRPPYLKTSDLRTYVVSTEEWNASAMGNGAIWVYSGLLEDMTDDEIGIILGHELAHYTHEHSRRGAKKQMWIQLAALAGVAGSEAMGDGTAQAALLGTLLGATAWQSGYSRNLEDQADRVGLRYAYEGGFDVERGPGLWQRFREKYGEANSFTNFFAGSHSRPSDRIRNLQRELDINYR